MHRTPHLIVRCVLMSCLLGACPERDPDTHDTPPRPEAPVEPKPEPLGSLDGSFEVSSYGAATFELDLELPPATGGPGPELSLVYDSASNNGALGVGWRLRGLSSITRCPQVEVPDGDNRAVAFDEKDRFCIDGMRLVRIGDGPYYAPGATYRTEQDTWTRVVADDGCGSGPCTFTATNKDGWTIVFGGDGHATVPIPGRAEAFAWRIRSTTDLRGNTTRVDYLLDDTTGESLPLVVAYTENTTQGLNAQRYVVFEYDTVRADAPPRYTHGLLLRDSRRLISVSTEVSGTAVARYELTYTTQRQTGRSVLTAIRRCAPATGACLPPTHIAYTDGENRLHSPNDDTSGHLRGAWCAGDARQHHGDFDGDGRADLWCATADGRHYVLLSTGSGLESPNDDPDGLVLQNWCAGPEMSSSLVDFNGDGRVDLACSSTRGTHWVMISNGIVLVSPNADHDGKLRESWCAGPDRSPLWVNFDGVGTADLSCSARDGTHWVLLSTRTGLRSPNDDPDGLILSNWCHGPDMRMTWSDFNGDGNGDMTCASRDGTHWVKVSDGRGVSSVNSDPDGKVIENWCACPDCRVGTADVNGDRLVDWTCSDPHGTHWVLLSTGIGVVPAGDDAGPIRSNWCLGDASASWEDFNGDGLQDLQCSDPNGKHWVLLSRGTTLQSPNDDPDGLVLEHWCGRPDTTVSRLDFNGDGLGDLLCRLEDGTYYAMVHLPVFADLAREFTNGFGGSVEVDYRPLTDPDVYRRSPIRPEYPLLEVQTPLYVVAKHTLADGRGQRYAFAHAYTDARTDLRRRIWMGFATMTVTDLALGRSSRIHYDQTWPTSGFITMSEVVDRDGVLLARSLFTPEILANAPGVVQVVRTHERTESYDQGELTLVLERRFAWDAFGNVSVVSDLGDPADPADDFYLCSRHENDVARWRFGYVVESLVARTYERCVAFLAYASPAWEPTTDLQWSQTRYDDASAWVEKRSYDDQGARWLIATRAYDGFGNVVRMHDPGRPETVIVYDTTYHAFPEQESTVAKAGDDAPLTRLTSYEPRFGQLQRLVDENGNTHRWEHDDFGRLSTTFGPVPDGTDGEATVTLEHHGYGRDPHGTYDETRVRPRWDADDPDQWPWERVYIDGMLREHQRSRRTERESVTLDTFTAYDEGGRVARTSFPSFSDETPAFTTTSYDLHNRPVETRAPDGTLSRNDYVMGERRITTRAAVGTEDERVTTRVIDARGEVVAIEVADGGVTRFSYDPLSQQRLRVGPRGETQETHYDALGRVTESRNSDTGIRRYRYDTSGRLEHAEDAVGNTTTFTYDTLDRVDVRRVAAPDGSEDITTYVYDQPGHKNPRGALTGITTAAASYVFGYDRYSRLSVERLDIAGQTYGHALDYDPLGRTTAMMYPDGAVATTAYDTLGHVTALDLILTPGAEPIRHATYTDYDAMGRARHVSRPRAKIEVSSTYYTLAAGLGRLATQTIQKVGAATPLAAQRYEWNRVGQLRRVADPHTDQELQRFEYDTMGYLKVAHGPWPKRDYGYDLSGNLTRLGELTLTYPAESNQLEHTSDGATYGYDANGATIALHADVETTYHYDARGNLSAIEHGDSSAMRARYDPDGQRLERTDPDGTTTLYVSSDYVITRVANVELHTKGVLGPDGVLATLTVDAAAPDTRERLDTGRKLLEQRLRAGEAAPPLVTPRHDAKRDARPSPLPVHVQKATSTWPIVLWTLALAALVTVLRKRRRTFAPERGRLLGPVASLMLVVFPCTALLHPAHANLDPGPGHPIAPGELHFFDDTRGSVWLTTDSDGTLRTTVTYLPFGEIYEPASQGPNDFRAKFTGKEHDGATGLYYFGARYYAPSLGRFLSPDPAGQFVSPYLYAGNDPENEIDEDGEWAFVVALVLVGLVAGAYLGGAAVNHDFNPLHWDWKSPKTYGGIFAGAAIGAAGGALGGIAAEAGITAGIVGEIAVGAGENAAFTALGGGSSKEVAVAAAEGAVFGGIFGAAGAGLGRVGSRAGSRFARRGATELGGLATEEARAARQVGRNACNSFTPGTAVVTDLGETVIEDVVPGDLVWSYDETLGLVALNTVSDVTSREVDRVLELTVSDGDGEELLETTSGHPFFVAGAGWRPASALRIGDHLETRDGAEVVVTDVVEVRGRFTVHNFEVEEAHTYYITPFELLVHNPPACPIVPTVRGGKFGAWWDAMPYSTFKRHWNHASYGSLFRTKIKSRLRQPGGLHEWIMVSRADRAKKWRVSFDFFANQTRTPTAEAVFQVRATRQQVPHNGGQASHASLAHGELGQIADDAKTFSQFKRTLRSWASGERSKRYRWRYKVYGGANNLPNGFH